MHLLSTGVQFCECQRPGEGAGLLVLHVPEPREGPYSPLVPPLWRMTGSYYLLFPHWGPRLLLNKK